jgi:hypothetical protein
VPKNRPPPSPAAVSIPTKPQFIPAVIEDELLHVRIAEAVFFVQKLPQLPLLPSEIRLFDQRDASLRVLKTASRTAELTA